MKPYGAFSEDGTEFVLPRPDPPRPWINYLSNDRYCSLISQTGGGFSFIQGAGFDRVMRGYPGDMVLYDRPGRYFYLRDRETGEVWSLGWQPVRKELDRFEARHGQGYTRISSSYQGLSGEVTFFVPGAETFEVWLATLTNDSDRPRKLDLFTYCEWTLGSYQFDLLDRSFANLMNETAHEDGILYATKRIWRRPDGDNVRWDKTAFMAASRPAVGFDCSKEAFIGMYRSHQDPLAVHEGACRGSSGTGRDACAVLQFSLELAPGASEDLHVLVGVGADRAEIREAVGRFKDADTVRQALAERQRYFRDYLSSVDVRTPDADFNRSLNTWNPYQAWVTSRWSRMASFYAESKSVLGFRDSCQDVYGVLPHDVPWAIAKTRVMLAHQYADGNPVHVWEPLTDHGDPSNHADDPLWLVFLVTTVLKETGDLDFLSERVPYYDQGEGTVLEHVQRALAFSLSKRSPRGLSLIRQADWNDALDRVGNEGRGESVMNSHFLAWMLEEAAELGDRCGATDWAADCRREAKATRNAVNAHAWAGQWYVRGTRDDGTVFGKPDDVSARIWLNSQTWAVLSGVATGERAVQVMDAVGEHLGGKYGPALFLPGFPEPDPAYGIITRFAPGTKENGTVFNHPVTWTILAECMLGRGDRAFRTWEQVSPMRRAQEPDVYKAEPYVYAEYTYGPDHPNYGQGEYTWTTGTAAWMYRVSLDAILGIKPTYEGLVIDPCLPSAWPEATVTREFRGATYRIAIRNPRGVQKGVTAMRVDGQDVDPNLPLAFDSGEITVEVTLG